MQVTRDAKYEWTLSAELLEKAKVELNEDSTRRASDIETLRQWLLKQRHINGRTDDAFLLRFLRNCRFNIEMAKEKMEFYYTLKTALPEWFSGMNVKDSILLDIIKCGTFVPIGYDKEGRKVIIGRIGMLDKDKYNINSVFKVYQFIAEYISMDEQTQICGAILIFDFLGLGHDHAAQITLNIKKRFFTCMQDATPIFMKELHLFNTPDIFDARLAMTKPFMKPEVIQGLHPHYSSLESLHAAISPEILPAEYGGSAGDLSKFIDELEKALLELREYFIEEEKYKVDESKRSGKLKTSEDLFGADLDI